MCVCQHVHTYGGLRVCVCIRRRQFGELGFFFFFQHVGPEYQISQVLGLDGRCAYPLSYLIGSRVTCFVFFFSVTYSLKSLSTPNPDIQRLALEEKRRPSFLARIGRDDKNSKLTMDCWEAQPVPFIGKSG